MATNPEVKRIVAEIVGSSTTTSGATPQITREIAEVVGSPYPGLFKKPQIIKAVAEVTGQHQGAQFAQPQVNRLIEEVVGAAARLGSGFNLPNISVTNFTLFMVFNPIDWAANSGHEFSLVAGEPGYGIFIRQTPNSNEAEMLVRSGTDGTFSGKFTPANINTKHIVTIKFDLAGITSLIKFDGNLVSSSIKTGTFDTLILKYLCGLIQHNKKIKGELAEVILYSNLLSGGFINLMESYLNCKWIGAGPSESNNFCVPV